MIALEEIARSEERTLLTLDTVSGSKAELLYRSLDFIAVGIIPRYARGALTPELESFAWPPRWFPDHLTWAHLESVFELAELRSAVLLSVFVATASALLSTVLGTMLAYAMARRGHLRQAGMAEVATSVLHNVGNVLNSVNVASTCLSDSPPQSGWSDSCGAIIQ
jgi:hypothetical protein